MATNYIETIQNLSLKNKYLKYYVNIVLKALSRPQDRQALKRIYGYVESHHILPKSFKLGGEKDKNNLVFLTAKEHFILHLCLTKMFESHLKNKMIFAFRQLKSKNRHQYRRINSRLYSKIKPDRGLFIRLYKESDVKYLYQNQTSEILNLENNGWSRKMTDEYKSKSLGSGMTGKNHSQETKMKMSNSSKGIPKEHLRGKKRPKETIQKTSETKRKFKEENPGEYEKQSKLISERMVSLHRGGIIDLRGEKNGMFGKTHSKESLKKMSLKAEERWSEFKENKKEYEAHKQKKSEALKEIWKNPAYKQRASIFNSKAYKEYGMTPQQFYDEKLKPLLYLGFLPTAIVRYKLVDMSKANIKLMIETLGTEEDKLKFEENKKNGAGANKAYIQFQKDQYNKYFNSETVNNL